MYFSQSKKKIQLFFILFFTFCLQSNGNESIFSLSLKPYPDVHEGFERKVIFLPNIISEKINIDGKLTEASWKNAIRMDGYRHIQTNLPIPDSYRVKSYVLRGKNGLYIAFQGEDELPPSWGSTEVEDKEHLPNKVIKGHIFSVQFNPDLQDFNRMRFMVFKNNQTYALKGNLYPKWKPKEWKARYFHDPESLKSSAEFFIPYKLLSLNEIKEGQRIGFNCFTNHQELVSVPSNTTHPYRVNITKQYAWGCNRGESIAMADLFPWLVFGKKKDYLKEQILTYARIYVDRSVYESEDLNAFGLIECRFVNLSFDQLQYKLKLIDHQGKVVAEQSYQPKSYESGFSFKVNNLVNGQYMIKLDVIRDKQLLKSSYAQFKVLSKVNKKKQKKHTSIPLILTEHTKLGTGTYPITTGIPFPRGRLFSEDLKRLVVEKQVFKDLNKNYKTRWDPVPTQTYIRNHWSDGSIRWLGLNFEADYNRGNAHAILMKPMSGYRLNLDSQKSNEPKGLQWRKNKNEITIDTGRLKAKISSGKFNLFDSLSCDFNLNGKYEENEKVISSSNSPNIYHLSHSREIYSSIEGMTKLTVVEEGPLMLTLSAEGNYGFRDKKDGKFMTRIYFFANQPYVKVIHTHIFTRPTKDRPQYQVSIKIPALNSNKISYGGANGLQQQLELSKYKSTYLIQDRHNRFKIESSKRGKQVGELLSQGTRASGWACLETDHANIVLSSRRFWQLYPKEIEADQHGLSLHLWPKHGRVVYEQSEMQQSIHLAKALFAHQGKKLSFQCPENIYEALARIWSDHEIKKGKKPGFIHRSPFNYIYNYAHAGLESSGTGIAMSQTFYLHFTKKGTPIRQIEKIAQSHQADAHALADPKWTYESRVLGRLWPEDTVRFGAIERNIRESHQKVLTDYTERLEDYGQFIWPSYHQYSTSALQMATPSPTWFHRPWTNNHYQEGRTFMLLYLRSGRHYYWQYALDSNRHKMDVVTVNSDVISPGLPHKNPYGNYHVYGVFPWSGSQGASGHFQNHDYKAWHYYLTGDIRGLAQLRGWAREIFRTFWVGDSSRNDNGTLVDAIAAFQAIRDHRLLKIIYLNKRQIANTPIKNYALPYYDPLNLSRILEYTRDEGIQKQLLNQWNDGKSKNRHGMGNYTHRLLYYELTKDRRFLHSIKPIKWGKIHPPVFSQLMMMLPYVMSYFYEIEANGSVLMNQRAYEQFWAQDIAQWRKEEKKYAGKKY